MRVISGKYRGRVLNSPKNEDIRPTIDMVKEAVFSMLQDYLYGARFVDLFAGSGSIGIEALSRGADDCVFADKSKDSIDIVKSNLDKLGATAEVLYLDYLSALHRLRGGAYDIIYIDPPFANTDIKGMAELILKYKVLDTDGIIVYESLFNKKDKPQINGFTLIKSKKYGTIAIDVYQLNSSEDSIKW